MPVSALCARSRTSVRVCVYLLVCIQVFTFMCESVSMFFSAHIFASQRCGAVLNEQCCGGMGLRGDCSGKVWDADGMCQATEEGDHTSGAGGSGDCADDALDACGVCGGDGTTCLGCDKVPNSGWTEDKCGVCGGDGSSCLGCDGLPNSGKVTDACGICGGSGLSCAGCDGRPNSGRSIDECGVCGGPGIRPGKCDCAGNVVDSCGTCGGLGLACQQPSPAADVDRVWVQFQVNLALTEADFTAAKRVSFRAAVAQTFSVNTRNVTLSSITRARPAARRQGASKLLITIRVAAHDTLTATRLAETFDVAKLNQGLVRMGIPAVALEAKPVVKDSGVDEPAASVSSDDDLLGLGIPVLIGLSVGIVSMSGLCLCLWLRARRASKPDVALKTQAVGQNGARWPADMRGTDGHVPTQDHVVPAPPSRPLARLGYLWPPDARPDHRGSVGRPIGAGGGWAGQAGNAMPMTYRPNMPSILPDVLPPAHSICTMQAPQRPCMAHTGVPPAPPIATSSQACEPETLLLGREAGAFALTRSSVTADQDHEKDEEIEHYEDVEAANVGDVGTDVSVVVDSVVDSEACVVCLEAQASHALIPCGHRCVCASCQEVLRTCPMCRAVITSALRVFT